MALASDRTNIFISYSHHDQIYLERLHTYLAYYEKKGNVVFWDDTRIQGGSRWYREIERAITSARVAILLVSADYLASKFIQERELPPLLEAARNEDVTILSVILSPCAFENTPLAQFQPVNSPSKPLISMNLVSQIAVWEKVVEIVQNSLASLHTPVSVSSDAASSNIPDALPVKTALYTYRGHTTRVNAVRWSPEGNFIASTGNDHTVQLWDAITGMRFTTFRGDKGFDLAIAWSPDGKYLAIGGDANTVLIHEAQTKKLQNTYRSEAQLIAALAWSPDGRYLATASANIWPYLSARDIVEVFEPFTGERVFTHDSSPRATAALAWSPDSQYLAFASNDGLIEVLDIASTSLFQSFHGDSDQVNALMWSPDGKYIAAGNADGTVQLWIMYTGKVVSTYNGHSGSILTLAWSPDGEYIASASEDKTVQLWNVLTGQTVQTYYGHSGMVFSVAWSPDGRRIATAGQDKTVQIWQFDFIATEESKEQWLLNANSYSQARRYEEALSAYDRAILLDPNYALSYLNKGETLYKLKRYREALSAIDHAILLEPNFARSYHSRGNVLSKLGEEAKAVYAYKQALELEKATGDEVAEQLEYSSLDKIQATSGHIKETEGYYEDVQSEQTTGTDTVGQNASEMNIYEGNHF